jgi:hypothetical protein
MSKQKLLLWALIILLPIGLAGCDWFNKNKVEQEAVQPEVEVEDFTGSMQDLIGRGKPVKCTYSGEEDDGDKFSGVLYIADNKARQDAKGEENGKITEVHTIVEDHTVYFWTSANPTQGMKMEIDQTEAELEEFGQDVQEAGQDQEWQKEFDYKCSKWKIDKSKFELPAGVEFMNISDFLMGQMGDMLDEDLPDRGINEDDLPGSSSDGMNMDDLKQQMCTMCGSAPDPAECRLGLGCD